MAGETDRSLGVDHTQGKDSQTRGRSRPATARPVQRPSGRKAPAFITRYEVPGHEPLIDSDTLGSPAYERYRRDKGQWDEKIKHAVGLKNRLNQTYRMSESEKVAVCEEGLGSENVDIQVTAAKNVQFIDSQATKDRFKKLVAAKVREGLSSKNPNVWPISAEMIQSLESLGEDIGDLRQAVLRKVEEAFAIGDAAKMVPAIEMISHVPDLRYKDLLTRALLQEDSRVRLTAAEKVIAMQYSMSVEDFNELEELITVKAEEGLASHDRNTRRRAMLMTGLSLPSKQVELVSSGLESSDSIVRYTAATLVDEGHGLSFSAEDRDQLMQKITEKVRNGLGSQDPEEWTVSAMMIAYAPVDQQSELYDLTREKLGPMLSNDLVKPFLYAGYDISTEQFARVPFDKTDSETTLLGGRFKNKVVLRHIDADAFQAWQKLFESHKIWNSAGFEYVPIEPILSYRLNKQTGMVDVATGVLDISFELWIQMGGGFVEELEADMGKISDVLDRRNVVHGHEGVNNFCLRFERDGEGNVDFTRKPRIYLIDFDLATTR